MAWKYVFMLDLLNIDKEAFLIQQPDALLFASGSEARVSGIFWSDSCLSPL